MADRLSNPSWPNRSGDLVVPFVFIPDGVPEPSEWPFSLTNAVRMRAMFVPSRDDGAGQDRQRAEAAIAPADATDTASVDLVEKSADVRGRRPAAYGWPSRRSAVPPGPAAHRAPPSDAPPGRDHAKRRDRNERVALAQSLVHAGKDATSTDIAG